MGKHNIVFMAPGTLVFKVMKSLAAFAMFDNLVSRQRDGRKEKVTNLVVGGHKQLMCTRYL